MNRSLVNNAIIGANTGYEKTLELTGVGYRASLKGKQLNLQLGFSHDINFDIPENIKITVEKQTIIKIFGADKQLVGLVTEDPNEVLEEGAQIVSELNKKPVDMLGHVTSSYYSPNLNKSIALAVVRSGKTMLGKKLFVPMENKTIKVTVENPVFLDKENKRLNA